MMMASTFKYTLIVAMVTAFMHDKVNAQDQHFTQFSSSAMLLNPALTGMSSADRWDYRVGIQHRDQWRSLSTKPFINSSAFFDMRSDRFGYGIIARMDKNGSTGHSTLNLMLSGAYDIINGGRFPTHQLSVGLQLGLLQRTFDPANLSFEQQYDGSGFDPGLSSGEAFERNTYMGLDGNVGLSYVMVDKNRLTRPFGGAMLAHFTSPKRSFTNASDRTPMRVHVHGGAEMDVNDRLMLRPELQYMLQAKVQQINLLAQGQYELSDPDYDLLFGLGYRTEDAAVLLAGLKYKQTALRISYDHNLSYLKRSTGGVGAFEVSVVHAAPFGTRARSGTRRY